MPTVHRWMSIADLVDVHPDVGDILALYGLHCIGCAFSGSDTLEDGALLHGLTDDDIDNILIDINDLLENKKADGTSSFLTITLTEAGAKALEALVEKTLEPPFLLAIHIDDEQKFFLEPITECPSNYQTFSHALVPHLSVAIEDALLRRIHGGTIDFRDGRLKLDLPKKENCCKKKKEDVL